MPGQAPYWPSIRWLSRNFSHRSRQSPCVGRRGRRPGGDLTAGFCRTRKGDDHEVPPLAGLEILSMDDEQVRAHCLKHARFWLATYEIVRRTNDDHLETATQYAVLADAFRPGPAPAQE